jgi:hypothetical protein
MNRTTYVRTEPQIDWYIYQLINHPDFNPELLLELYNELKTNENE